MRIVLIGPPGSGKGTQAKRVATHYQVPHVTVAGALADIAAEDSELGRLVKETIETNRVSDDLIIAVLRVRLTQADAANGFVLDGFPRTVAQAETLETVLDGVGRPLDVVLLVDVDPDELMERLVGRLTCEGCGAVYNVYANPPTVEGVCDRCGGRVSRRPDDYEETISNRLRIFESQTAQVIDHFKLHGKLRRVSGEGGSDEVFEQIRRIVDATPRTVIEMEPVVEAAELLPATFPALTGAPARQKATKATAKAAAAKAAARPTAGAKAAAAATVAAFKQVAAEVAAAKTAAKKAPAKAATPAKPTAKAAAKPAVPGKAPTPTKPEKAAARPAGAPVVVKKPAAGAAAKAPSGGRKGAVKKAPAKTAAAKPAARKAAAKKPAAKKTAVPKKAAPKKAVAKKPLAGKAAAKKAAPKKSAAKPAAKKTAAPKKAPAKKKPARPAARRR
jgi:adenylate kinase